MDRKSDQSNERPHLASLSDELVERYGHKRHAEINVGLSPDAKPVSLNYVDREPLPPIEDQATVTRQQPYVSSSFGERQDDDISSSRTPVGMVGAGYMPSYTSSNLASVAPHFTSRHPEPYRYDDFSVQKETRRQASHSPTNLSQIPQNTDHSPGTHRAKRPRVSLACLFCRNRKSRCDGIRPTCKTCAHMKLDCKWPESDLRRAKPNDRPPPAAQSAANHKLSQPSPISLPPITEQNSGTSTLSDQANPESLSEPRSLKRLPAERFVRVASSGVPRSLAGATSDRYGTSQLSRPRASSDYHPAVAAANLDERFRSPMSAQDKARDTKPISSAYRQSEEFASTGYGPVYDDRQGYRPLQSRRGDHRTQTPNLAAAQCRARAAQIAILSRPSSDTQRRAIEGLMSREASLENLVSNAGPEERLEIAFSSNWDALGGLSPSAYRPFMDVVAGILGIVEVKMANDADSVHTPLRNCRLHLFRLVNEMYGTPDLRHCIVALDVTPFDERELRRNCTSYNSLGYPIPVDRLKFSLDGSALRVLAELKARTAEATERYITHRRSPIHSASEHLDTSPSATNRDIKPGRAVTEEFFDVVRRDIGEQMPGLDFELIGERIRNGSVSPLLANALCCIGASLCERTGRGLPRSEALGSEAYLRQSRALIGSALGKEDLETVLALGVIGIRDILVGLWTSAATIVSSAMRLCIQLDLHQSHSSTSAAPSGRELDGRTLFWMIYSLDRITALATAKPTTIKDGDIDVPFPPTMQNSEPCIFSALVRQLHYAGGLAEISSGTGRHSDAERQRSAERDLISIEEDLVGHYESFPATLRLNEGNVRRAHELGQGLSFLQLHLTHFSALIRCYLMSRSVMTDANLDLMRTAAYEIGEICLLSQALDGKSMSDSPLSSAALFLSGCVALADIEMLEELDDKQASRKRRGGSPQTSATRNLTLQLEAARSTLATVTETLERQAWFWPAARNNLEILTTQSMHNSMTTPVSESALLALIDQVEAVQVIVRRPDSPGVKADVRDISMIKVQRETDLDQLLATFPQMF